MIRSRLRQRGWWGFRGKLALSIALSFILLGTLLVSVQLLILSQSIANTIDVRIGSGSGSSGAPPGSSGEVTGSSDCVATSEATDCKVVIPEDAATYSRAVASDVMQSYIIWSVLLLVTFSVVAAIFAWLLTRSPANKISSITALARDISEHDLSRRLSIEGPRDEITELGDRIDTMLARLEVAFNSQDQFVSNASHELRTPVTAVRTALEAPLTQGRVPDELQPYFQRALRSTQRMDELITALLLIARSRHLHPHELHTIDLKALLEREIDEASDSFRIHSLTVTEDLSVNSAHIAGNAQAVSIAVRNLLANAVQHNREGGRVDIRLAALPDHRVVLTVSNTGSVYDDAEVSKLTHAFNRGHQTRLSGTPGSGLGLAIVDSIVNAHDADLSLQSRPSGGLIVEVTFRAIPSTTH